jgi:hypothetical protein
VPLVRSAMDAVTHLLGTLAGIFVWTRCGLRFNKAEVEDGHVVFADVPTCLWCVANARLASAWEGPAHDVIIQNTVAYNQMVDDDQRILRIIEEETKA